ncbi:MAG: hypothetical protein O2821_09475 [Chloroflexi bacterium]|nr:hypothetical protein [Chloroflexota bacterium]MDA1226576.1 hypothetical protein [Chloroflexota bacterium]
MISFKKIGIMSATAAVLAVGSFSSGAFASPVDAAKMPKFDVCHYQAEDELLLDELGVPVLDEFGNPTILDPAGWRMINVSGSALPAHIDGDALHPGHTDGTTMDYVITDQAGADACTVLINS